MSEVRFQDILNIKADGNVRRFFRAINEFLPLLYSEYALSLNLNSDTELYKSIRMCIQEGYITTNELLLKLSEDDSIKKMICLFPTSDDIDDWSYFLKKCSWNYCEGNNFFVIDGNKFVMPEAFLHLVIAEDKAYAYKYAYDKSDGSCWFECFNSEVIPVEPIEIDNPFLFKADKMLDLGNPEGLNIFEMTEEEFFELPSINSSDEEQRKAICAGVDNNIVVLAGAGSGKTRTLVNRLVYLHMVKKIPLERILLLTFTKNAAENMKLRGEEILSPIYESLTEGKTKPNIRAKTIDAFVYGLIRENYQEIGFTEDPILKLDGTPQTKAEYSDLLNETIIENDMQGIFSRYYQNGAPNASFKYLLGDVERYACGMSINYAGIERLLYEFVHKQLSNHTVYGFAYCNYLVKEAINNPTSAIKDIIASRYDCILMDEFQDINILQNETFEPFYGTKMHFTFVGDDDQSIYGWRGSDNSIIKKLVTNSNVDTYYLLTNYRNNPNIVKAGNVILNQVVGRAKKNQPIKPFKSVGPKIRIATYDDKYTNLSNEVERLIQSGYAAEDISILSRNNDDKIRVIHALSAAEIPVARERIRIDVNDNYKLLKAIISILNEYDIIAACREIKRISGDLEVTEHYIQKLVNGNVAPVKALINIYELANELRNNAIADMATAVNIYSLKAGELFEKAVNDHHSDPVFDSFQTYCSNNSAPWPISAKQLREIFRTFEDNTRKENQSGGALDNGVKTSTIHSAKGLEYDVVMITGLSLGKYPDTEKIDKNYNLRCAQLETLKNSRQALETLQKSVNPMSFATMIRECADPGFDKIEAKALLEFKNEIMLCGQKDVMGLTAKGVSSFLDSYKYYIDPLEKRYVDSTSKSQKKAMMYKERQEILGEEISLLEQDDESSDEKRADLNTVSVKLKSLIKRIRKQKERLSRFEDSISQIKEHYRLCLAASSYLSEVMKLNELELLKKELADEKEKSINEERRLFYVALTRARELLYLCRESGAPSSQFIDIIPDELKEEYVILTKEDEKEFLRLKQSLAKNVHNDVVDNNSADIDADKLITSNNFKGYIDTKFEEFIRNNSIFKELPDISFSYFKKAMGLLFIGEYTGSDFRTEFAHNIQRASEALLIDVSGINAKLFKTDDVNLAGKIANEIHVITSKCETYSLGVKYVEDLLTKESRFGDELKTLKSAGIFHFIVRSDRYSIPEEILDSWSKTYIIDNPEAFLLAVTDIANTRNALIHPSEKQWKNDPVSMALRNLEIVIIGCRDQYNGQATSECIHGETLQLGDIDKGVHVNHHVFGEGLISKVNTDAFIVNFNCGESKLFMKSSAARYFTRIN